LIHAHRLSLARQLDSPNCSERPPGYKIDLLVIHSISLPPGQYGGSYIDEFFCNQLRTDEHPYFLGIAELRVSAHLLIRRNGEIHQYVPFDKKAWHAGVSSFCGVSNCNDYSIGIELEGCDNDEFTPQQYQQLAHVSVLLQKHYPAITAQRTAGHSDIAPGRKTDPGPCFNWEKYKQLCLLCEHEAADTTAG
jgi:N-acetyl-anhydromuramoyl-L-alanine amidase